MLRTTLALISRIDLYEVKYRTKLALALYGYQYSLYTPYAEPIWPWYQYLCGDLRGRPHPYISFSDYDDAVGYMYSYPHLRLQLRKERYVP